MRQSEVGAEPRKIWNPVGVEILAENELAALQDLVALGESDELTNEAVYVAMLGEVVPIKPADLVVLAVSVVVALLRA